MTTRQCCAIAIAVSLWASPHAFAQASSDCTTLGEVMRLARENDPRVATRHAQKAGAEADLVEARSLFQPQVTTFARTGAGDVGLIDSSIQNQIGISASQRVIDFGDARLARKAARFGVDAGEYEIATAELVAADSASASLLDMLEAGEAMALTGLRQQYFEDQIAAIDAVLEQGGATLSERAEVAAQLANAKVFSLELKARYDRAATALSVQTGIVSGLCERAALEDSFASLASGFETIELAVDGALQESPELRGMRARADSVAAESKREQRARLPIISVVGSAAYSSSGGMADQFELQERVGVDVSIPVFSGNALTARSRRAKARYLQAQSETAERRRALEQDVRISFQNILSLEAQIIAANEFEYRSQELFDFAQLEYDAGRRTLPELVEVRLEYEQAGLRRIQTKFQLLRERLRLFILTGGRI